jgi:uncharacterized protein (TIGR03066 family)
MNALRMLVASVAVCALASGARAEEKKADNAKLLMGSWEATKVAPKTLPVGAVVEFAKDGKMKVTEKRDGKEETREGTYKVDGDKFTIKMKRGDEVAEMVITIKKISDSELITANAEGAVVEFKKKTK